MAKYNLNDVALHNVKNHIFVQNDKCNTARIKAIKDGKIESDSIAKKSAAKNKSTSKLTEEEK